MKKALIAGAASVALAAMPVVGAFAAVTPLTQAQDTLILTVADTCTITRGTTTNGHAVGGGTGENAGWGSGSGAGNETVGNVNHIDTFSATVSVNQSYSALATSSFHVVCNHNDGYKVTATSPTNFIGSGSGASASATWSYVAGGTLDTSGDSMWTIDTDETEAANKDLANSIVSQHTNATTDGADFVVTYKAFVDSSQPADTYTASVSYVLAEL